MGFTFTYSDHSCYRKNYKVKFRGIEILKIKNMGELQGLIESKLTAANAG